MDIEEFVKIRGNVIRIYEGDIYRENFKTSHSRKAIEKLFALGEKNEDERNTLIQFSVKLKMNSLNGVQIRKDNNESYKCISHPWMETENDDKVWDFWGLPSGNFTVKFKKDDGSEGDIDFKNTLPSHLGAFILSKSKRIMDNIIREIDEF